MQNYIKSVSISGLWDIKSIYINFNEDVNILIGGNGSGKTTFLCIIESLLNVDLATIEEIVFDEVLIIFQCGEQAKFLHVERHMEDVVTPVYRYTFPDGEVIDIKHSEVRMMYRSHISKGIYQHLKDKLGEFVMVSWLPINRLNSNTDGINRRVTEAARTDVDFKLERLMNQVVSYRLQLETKANERTKKFNEDLISLLLYNETYDTLPKFENLRRISELPTDEIITQLHKVFSYFGEPRSHTTDITKHAQKIHSVVNNLTLRKHIDSEDLLALALLNRTVAIFTLSSDYQKERADIMEPLKKYVDIVCQYLKDKDMQFDTLTGDFTAILKYGTEKKRKLSINSLSSGERQLLILLTETLLQQQRPFVFIADEPELSLHIEWQRNLINSIRELNPNAQIIFATHAPEIAASHPKKLINLTEVTKYVE